MSNKSLWRSRLARGLITCVLALPCLGRLHARIVDDFDDNTKTDWEDFTFVPGAFLPTEGNQQFTFDLTGAPQTLFSAAWKTAESYELKDGRTLELRVDMVKASGEDAFGIVGFIPTKVGGVDNNPLSLTGYSLAKDPTDVLITKGISKYFVDDDTVPVKNDNITLVLRLVALDGSVTITGRILDRDNNNEVIWEQTYLDTPAPDVLSDGTDDPPEPFITTGYFTLMCYAQDPVSGSPYSVTFDNAEVTIFEERVLDDFNDNSKTDWEDFTFVPGAFLPTEENGQFTFDLTGAPQTLFSAAWKTSENLELRDGESLELRVDMVNASGEDAFGIVGFIPTKVGGADNNPLSLTGYSLAKDPTDVLITKGISKYFVDDDTVPVKNDNITLVLRLVALDGSVTITGRILDRDNNNEVIWEQTYLDTPAPDVLSDGTDDPPEPFITTGYFTLMCYAQDPVSGSPYSVTFDNAVVVSSPQEGRPRITDIVPANFANFLPASTQIQFRANDNTDLSPDKLAVTLNGTRYTTAEGLNVTGTGTDLTASLGDLQADQNYVAVLEVEDAEGFQTTQRIYFDTFLGSHRVIEIEDYNFEAGQYINNPVPGIEGVYSPDGYSLQWGTEEVDFHDTRASASIADNPYREPDGARTQRTYDLERQKYTAAGGANAFVYDFDIGDIEADEWLNYTRNFTDGSYVVYLREALVNMDNGVSRLERVTSSPAVEGQTTQVLGSFVGERTGYQYRVFPLTDGTGAPVILQLNGVATLRLHQVTPDPDDGTRFLNYMVFIPVPDPGQQRATVIGVIPNNGSVLKTVRPVIEATLVNRDTSVKVETVQFTLNGAVVPATVTPTAEGASLVYAMTTLPPTGAVNTGEITFLDSEDVEVSKAWQFTVEYIGLDPANRSGGSGKTAGFNVRMVQAPPGTQLESSLARAEEQLAPNSTIPIDYETNVVDLVINYSQSGPGSADGSFQEDAQFPGVEPAYHTDLFALEVTTYLELTPGAYRFGTQCDDGYKVQSVKAFTDVSAPPLAFWSGPRNATYDFVVTQGGLYPFRLVYYEQGGGAHLEWFSQDLDTGARTLLNAAGAPIRAWSEINTPTEFAAPTFSAGELGLSWTGSGTLEEADSINGPWTPAPDQSNPQTLTVPATGSRFYRISP